jgi:hypothetical protein
MKATYYLAAVFVVLASLSAYAKADDFCSGSFCDGFQHGYATGYKASSRTLNEPIPVACPNQQIRYSYDPIAYLAECEQGYLAGLQQGETAGQQR